MKRKIYVVLGILAILGTAYGLMELFSQKEEEEKKVVAEVKRYVKTSQVAYTDIPTELSAFGRVNSALPLDITSEVSGRMLQGNVSLRAGQKFRKGAMLFRIDNTESRLRLQAAKSTFLKDVSMLLPDMKIDYAESFETWQNYFNALDVEKAIPELPKYKNNKEKTFLSTRNIYTSYYNIKSTEANLRKHNVYAPFSGTIAEVAMQIGSFVNPGSRVAKIIKTSTLELNVAVDPNDIKWVKEGASVAISTELGDMSWKGKVVRIGDILNSNTQALDVFVQVIPNENKVYEGMYLKATLPGSKINNAMEIPRAALVENKQVYTLKQDSLLAIKEVKVHKLNSETAIVSGLGTSEILISEPVIGAYEGMKLFKLDKNKKVEASRDSDSVAKK
ncbi:MAG: membrane fusion protein (multidrug efflux system) [Bacteroidia bacterium]|jgi:membrane fusion protein (multidrug efflux system)